MEAIGDVVDRAVETGKPIYLSAGGRAALIGTLAPMTISGLNVIRYASHLAIERGARPIMLAPFARGSQLIPLLDGLLREAAVSTGKPEAYNRDDVRYYGSTTQSWAMGLTSDLFREGVAGLITVGAESTSVVGAHVYVRMLGGINILGTARIHGNGPFAIIADYPLIGDDVLVAGSYVSGDPVMRSGVWAGDVLKIILMGLLIGGAILSAAGVPILSWMGG
jgi:hypothetical protein